MIQVADDCAIPSHHNITHAVLLVAAAAVAIPVAIAVAVIATIAITAVAVDADEAVAFAITFAVAVAAYHQVDAHSPVGLLRHGSSQSISLRPTKSVSCSKVFFITRSR
jgi:hypothetical protein